MNVLAIAAIVLATLAVGVALWRVKHPEDISGHADEAAPDTNSERTYGYAERPAGPDAEGMAVGEAGDIAPGRPSDRPEPGDR